MKYYSISNETNEKIIGKKYPQCKGMPSNMGLTFKWFEQPNSMTKLTNDDFPDFEPELIFELEEKAILTDVVSPSNISAKGFLINQKVKDIFSHFNLMEHRYYPSTLIVKGNKLPYYWLHFKDSEEKYLSGVDYSESHFSVTNLAYIKIEDIQILSRDDFWNKKMNLPMKHIRVENLALTDKLKNQDLDLFYIPYIHSHFFSSDRLIEVLKAYNIRGVEVKEQSIL